MKKKITFVLSLLLTTVAFANNDEDCAITLSLFAEPAKIGNYDTAFPYLEQLRDECPDFHKSIYQYGERIYKDRIEKATTDEAKRTEFNEFKKLLEERLRYFPEDTSEGTVYSSLAQVMFDNQIGSTKEQFEAFDRAYNSDKEGFTSPKSIYTYFSLSIELFDNEQMDIQDVFVLYDEIINKIEIEENLWAERITPLIEKQDRQETLSSSEERLLNAGEINLSNYSKVKGSVNGKLGNIADCDNLVPMYERDFEEKKNDQKWLQIASERLSAKECEAPIFFKLAEQLHKLDPSAKSAYYLGQLAEADGKTTLALEYYNQSAELQTNPNTRAGVYYKIAENFRKRGSFSQARNFYRKAIDSKPSMGRAYLQMADMYSKSSNDCGSNVFEKRAINWLAADLANTAARVDPSVAANAKAAAKSYLQRAPTKQDIFTEGMAGKTVTFNCWVGGSVKVPQL